MNAELRWLNSFPEGVRWDAPLALCGVDSLRPSLSVSIRWSKAVRCAQVRHAGWKTTDSSTIRPNEPTGSMTTAITA